MKPDCTTKVLLLLIALGLWANALVPALRPAIVAAARPDSDDMERDVHNIAHDVHSLYSGICLNTKICN